MKWQPHKEDELVYDLAHLHPQVVHYQRPSEKGRPAESYKVEVNYTLHCFTRKPKPGTEDKGIVYLDNDEGRFFDLRRYEMSKQLPSIIACLPNCKPRTNGQSKFFTFETVAEGGERVEYDIFFKLRKVSKGKPLEMIVETAFIRDPDYDSTRPSGKPIRFWIILHNTLNGKRIQC